MPIAFKCEFCGEGFRVSSKYAGKRVRCTECKASITVPGPAKERQPSERKPKERPASEHSVDAPSGSQAGAGTKTVGYPYWFFAITLIPLAITLFSPGSYTQERFEKTLADTPVSVPAGATLDDVLMALPERKIVAAFLPRDTGGHWVFALLSGAAFMTLAMLVFPRGNAAPDHLVIVALFTGTFGIILLLLVQMLAVIAASMGGNPLMYVVNFVGYAYHAALDPDSGFLASLAGYTFGVGFCEELCKALPLIWFVRTQGPKLDWRGAALWGVMSGVGFGISEGIHYSTEYYNGMAFSQIYAVRFVSCVALHATWAASVAILIARNPTPFDKESSFFAMLQGVFAVGVVAMFLHGLYDAALKFELFVLALATAVGSVVYLGALIKSAEARAG